MATLTSTRPTARRAPAISEQRPPAALIRKLHRWELLHLREHAAELEARLDALTEENERLHSDVAAADARADMFADGLRELEDAGAQVGLTRDGRIVAMQSAPLRLVAVKERLVLAKGAGPGVWNRWSTYCGGRRVMRAHVWGRYSA